MLCQFKPIAKVDVINVNNQLSIEENGGEGRVEYDISSGFDTLTENGPELVRINDCYVSLSPGGEFMAFASHKDLCIFSAKWDSNEEDDVKTKYRFTWKCSPCLTESEKITAVICLPLIMPSKPSRSSHSSEQCNLDWTCIAVGFSSGYLRFYDEGGGLLLSERIYDEPIMYLKCQSFKPSKTSSYDEFPEELYVTFQTTVAIIPGFALFQTLRACRNQLAKVKANIAENLSPPPLTLKKWAFADQGRLRDCEFIGPSSSDLFDHLMTASICGGFNSCYRSGAPKSTIVVAAGKGPYIGFHHALEGVEGRSVLTDVAQAVKSKFKGLFRSSGSDRQRSAVEIETPENLACRFGICDFSREADHIVRSPNREYSAVTDTFGRVTLINNIRGIAVRMWKGYRKAQCGWLQVEEEEPSTKGNPKHLLRTVLFLVIYDPKKGMLEVWTIPNGIRVAAFSCSKKGRLLYTSHGLVGLNNVAVQWANKGLSPCVFLDPKGTLFQVIVPFHCALSDATGERASDLALLRKLKSILRETDLEDEQLAQEVGLIAAEMKTTEVRKLMLLNLISNKHVTVDALEAALVVFTDRVMSEDPRGLDSHGLSLLLSSQQLQNLIGFYKFVLKQQEIPPNYSSVVPQQGVSDLQAVFDILSVSEREVSSLKSLLSVLDSCNSFDNSLKREPRVTFNEDTSTRSVLVNYLSCFEFGKKSAEAVAPNAVAMKKLPPNKLHFLADLLFQGILYSDTPTDVWQAEASCSGILPSHLLQLAIQFWLHRKIGKALEVEMIRFSQVIRCICLLQEVNSCDLSSLWSSVRSMLVDSYQPFNALTAALVCRAVASSLENNHSKKDSKSPKKIKGNTTEEKEVKGGVLAENDTVLKEIYPKQIESRKSSNEWEDVSWDSVKWTLLIGRLEDVALLDLVLSQNPADFTDQPENTSFPCLRYEKPNISFRSLLQKGKGGISEQVAKWLTTCGLDPKLLIEKSDLESTDKNVQSPKAMDVDEPGPEDKSEMTVREGIPVMAEEGMEASLLCAAHMQIFNNIYLLKRHFPYSLCGSVLVSNISWELMLEWRKIPENINILDAAVQCMQIVPNIHLRHGLCSLMWSSHLKQHFETATKVINESNGIPKEKLCRKELQMSETQFVDFSEICLKFIDLFIEATNMSEVIRPPRPEAVINRSEDLWEYNEHESFTSTQSLTNLALLQPRASFDHLNLLHQLAETINIILALGLRGQQLTPLFKTTDWSIFFSDSLPSSQKVEQHSFEPQLTSRRSQFLTRAVASAMQSVVSSDPSHMNDTSQGVSPDMSTAMQWFGKCQDLAYTWDVNTDPLRRHQVCLLYSSGHDRLAEEIMPAVKDLDVLASQLLLICGQRLRLNINNSSDLMEKISNLDTVVTTWLFELNTQGVRKVPLADTALLATHVVQHIPNDHPEYPLAVDLYDALEALSSFDADE